MATAHVVFATITGNNEDIADIITEKLEQLGVDVTESEISQTDADSLEDADICVVCPYTYDDGNYLKKAWTYDDLQDEDLSGKVYGWLVQATPSTVMISVSGTHQQRLKVLVQPGC